MSIEKSKKPSVSGFEARNKEVKNAFVQLSGIEAFQIGAFKVLETESME